MGLNGSTLLASATVSATGGTVKTYTTDGLKVNNGLHLIDASVADGRVRPSITVKSIPAKVNSDGKTWSNDKREVVVTNPKIITDLSTKFPNVRITLTSHPENTQTEIDLLCNLASQALFDADFSAFWRTGSQA